MQHLKEIVLPNYPLVLSLLKYRNVWVFWNKKKIVLLNYPLGLSLLKYKNVWVFWNKKKSGLNRCNPLNSSIDIWENRKICCTHGMPSTRYLSYFSPLCMKVYTSFYGKMDLCLYFINYAAKCLYFEIF